VCEENSYKFLQIFFGVSKNPLLIANEKICLFGTFLVYALVTTRLQHTLMTPRNRTASLLVLLPMFFISCDNVEHAAQSAAKKPIPAIMVALELERTIRAKFANDEILKRAELDAIVQADKNEATLSGTVSSEQLRDQAIQLARSAQSGLTVNDKIAIRPPA